MNTIKARLARVRSTSLRYRFVTAWWDKDTIKRSKACKFYWVMMPTSLLGYILVSLWVFLWGLSWPIAWLIGRSPNIKKVIHSNGGWVKFYGGYKCSPRTNHQRRFAPWQIVLPLAAIGGVGWSILTGNYYPAGVVLLSSIAYLVARLVRQGFLHKAWDRVCPTLNVVEREEKQAA